MNFTIIYDNLSLLPDMNQAVYQSEHIHLCSFNEKLQHQLKNKFILLSSS